MIFAVAVVIAVVWFIFKVVIPLVIIDIAVIAIAVRITGKSKSNVMLYIAVLGAIFTVSDLYSGGITRGLGRSFPFLAPAIPTLVYLNLAVGLAAIFAICRGPLKERWPGQNGRAGRITSAELMLTGGLVAIGVLIVVGEGKYGSYSRVDAVADGTSATHIGEPAQRTHAAAHSADSPVPSPTAPSTPSPPDVVTITALRGQAVIRMFEGAQNTPAPDDYSAYRTSFRSDSARYINARVDLHYAAATLAGTFAIHCTYSKDGEAPIGLPAVAATVSIGSTGWSAYSGWGWPEPGHWRAGQYNVSCRDSEGTIAITSFDVINGEDAVASASPPSDEHVVSRDVAQPSKEVAPLPESISDPLSATAILDRENRADHDKSLFPVDSFRVASGAAATFAAVQQALQKDKQKGVQGDAESGLVESEYTEHGIIGLHHYDRYVVLIRGSDASTWVYLKLLSVWPRFDAGGTTMVAETNQSFLDKRRHDFETNVLRALKGGR